MWITENFGLKSILFFQRLASSKGAHDSKKKKEHFVAEIDHKNKNTDPGQKFTTTYNADSVQPSRAQHMN